MTAKGLVITGCLTRTPAVIMKWNHRWTLVSNFCSEWHARETATGLALSLHGPSSCLRTSSATSLRSSRRSFRKVTFSQSVEVWSGKWDSLQMQMHRITVPDLHCAFGLPIWRHLQLRPQPILYKPDPHEAHLPPLPEAVAVPSGHLRDAQQTRTNLRELPHWYSQVWRLLDEESRVEDDQEGDIIYINSFYISHATNRFQDQGRPLRFGRHLQTWAEDISLVWDDLFDRNAPFTATLVTPDPPFNTMPDTVGVLLIVQHHDPFRTACLITAIDPILPRARIIQIAHSFDIVIPFRHVLFHGGVSDLCDERAQLGLGACEITSGRTTWTSGRPIRLFEGIGLTIRIPPPFPPEEWEERLTA